jgi:hypothetical protein
MTTRWIAQKNKSSCGPVAILNVLKWVDVEINYTRDYQKYKRKCKCTKEGTHQPYFEKSLNSIGSIEVKSKNLPTIREIEDSLSSEQLIVMKSEYYFNLKTEGHFFIVSEMKEDRFFLVNDTNGLHKWYGKEEFAQQYLQYHKGYCESCGTSKQCGVSPYAWFIKRKA